MSRLPAASGRDGGRPLLLLACLILAAVPTGAQRLPRDPLDREVDYARRKVYPALVNITVVMRYYTGGRAERTPAGGSGVIITPQGHVLTNYHVAGNTTRILCALSSGEVIEATVVAHDLPTDLSILRLRTEKRAHRSRPLPYAVLGDSDALRVGEHVIAMGNPLMLSSSLTLGVVSNTRRVFTDFTGTQMEELELEPDEKTGMFTRWIQHDAPILPGNSGGPLVNLRGQVVGINELGGGGVGFAIPSNTATRVLKSVLRDGVVRRGWLGITVLPVSKIGRTTGALISAVAPNSPAERATLAPGDILLSLGGAPTDVRFFEQVPLLYQRIADLPIGAKAPMRYLHAGRVRTSVATTALMPPFVGDEEEIRRLGVTVRGITDAMRLSRQLSTRSGVLVTGVRPGFPCDAANPRLAEGDVITALAGKPTPNLAAFHKTLAGLDGKEVALAFRRQDEDFVTSLKIAPNEPTDEGGELPKAWLGIKTQVVTPEVARALNVPNVKGFRITEVYPWTQASKAGLRTGDVITTLNGTPLDASRPQDQEDLRRLIEEQSVGDKAQLTLLRSGSPQTISVVLEATPAGAAQARKVTQEEFEFAVREIMPMDRMERRWKADQKGVLVAEVTTGGWAHMAGLRLDDLILAIQGKPVESVEAFQQTMNRVLKQHPRVIDIFVRRGYRTHFVFIEPDWAKVTAAK